MFDLLKFVVKCVNMKLIKYRLYYKKYILETIQISFLIQISFFLIFIWQPLKIIFFNEFDIL